MGPRSAAERLHKEVSLLIFEDSRGCDFYRKWLRLAGAGGEASLRKPTESFGEREHL